MSNATLSPAMRGRLLFLASAAGLLLVAPLVLNDFNLSLFAKYLCYAIVAVGIGLAWGRGGMLVLGQGVFFGLGAYAMAMHLKLADAGPGGVPDFIKLYGDGTLPVWWKPFRYAWFTLPAIVIIPMLVAWALGALVFRRRVKGAFFAILSQALAAALVIFITGQQGTTGGTNGLTDFKSFFGYNLNDPVNKRMVYVITAVVLLVLFLIVRQICQSRLGQLLVATRDAEERVRFLGYDPANVKLVAYVVAAGAAGLAGALFVPVVGAINPASIGVIPSIEMIIGVAIGGRATLVGPILGAVLFGFGKSQLSSAYPDKWLYVQGALLIIVVAFLPDGVASLKTVLQHRFQRPARDSAVPAASVSSADPAVMTGVTS